MMTKKLIKKLQFVSLFLSTLLSGFAFAQRSELIEHKTQLENLITDRMRTTIATTLEKSAFDVSVNVKLKEFKPPKPEPRRPEDINPAAPKLEDLQMGLIDAEELIRNYQAQIEELRLKREEANKVKDDKPLFEVTGVQVIVGLSEKIPEEYRGEFSAWLEKRVKADFGKLGTSAVNVIKQKVEPLPEPKTYIDHIRDFQPLIGVLIAIFGLLLAGLIVRSIRIANSEEQRQVQLTMQQAAAPQANKLDEIKELVINQKKSDVALAANFKAFQELSLKVVSLATQSDLDINVVFDTWLDSGGFKKVACVLDVILGSTHGTPQWGEVVKDLAIPEGYKVSLVETFKNMKDADLAAKIEILDGAYWDLMTFQTIGEKYVKTPFNYAASVDPLRLKDAIVVQPPKVRSVAVLSLPPAIQASLIAQMDSAQKLEILEGSIGLADIERQEIESISDALKFQINNKKNQKESVSSFDLLPGLLSTFTAHEETRYLADLWKRKSSDVQKLKFVWPTLAFIEQWKSEHLQRLLSSCTNEELEGLAATLPHAQTAILNTVTPKVREILNDSLPLLSKLSPEDLNKRLTTVRAKLLGQLKENNVKLEDLYESERVVSSAA